jgi:hypothetical protein
MKSASLCVLVGLIALGVPATTDASERKAAANVQRVTDTATGAEISVAQGKEGQVTIAVRGKSVTLRKQLEGKRLTTTIDTPIDHLRIVIEPASLSVRNANGEVTVSARQAGRADAARRMVVQSSALREAVALLGRIDLGIRSPLQHLLVITRASLLSMIDGRGASVELARWVGQAREAMRTANARFDMTPTECWNAYAKEAIEAATEFDDCMKHVSWWDFFGDDKCVLIYEMRAIGAMSWWIKCVSFS